MEPDKPKKSQFQQFKSVFPQIRELVVPRVPLLVLGFALLLINRVMGLALPYSTRTLGDVIGKHPVSQWSLPAFGNH